MRLWKPPMFRSGEEEEDRRVDWLELFFDLAFVAVIAALGHSLSDHISFEVFAQYIIMFASMWVIWRHGAIYADRFETEDVGFRISILTIMAAVIGMAVGAHIGEADGFRIFGIAYMAANAYIMSLWLRGGYHNPYCMRQARYLSIFHMISITFWAIALVVGVPGGWWIAAIALIGDFSGPLLTAHIQDNLPKLSTNHLTERFGLFTIIVLGEAVLSIASGMNELTINSPFSWFAAICAQLLVTGLFWLYFDQIIVRTPPQSALRRNLVQYLHFPLAVSISVLGIIMPKILMAPGDKLDTSSYLLLVGAMAVAFAMIALIDALMMPDKGFNCLFHDSRILEIIGAVLMVASGLLFFDFPAIVFVCVAVAMIITIIARALFVKASGVCRV
jgi:low temperature requirement protein LtrA